MASQNGRQVLHSSKNGCEMAVNSCCRVKFGPRNGVKCCTGPAFAVFRPVSAVSIFLSRKGLWVCTVPDRSGTGECRLWRDGKDCDLAQVVANKTPGVSYSKGDSRLEMRLAGCLAPWMSDDGLAGNDPIAATARPVSCCGDDGDDRNPIGKTIMNFYQSESFLAKSRRARDATDGTVKSIPEAQTDNPNAGKAKKKAAFLRAFQENCSVTISARLAGIDRTTHYEWLAKDARYKAGFERSLMMMTDGLKDRLCDLVQTGVFKPVIYKGRFCYEPRTRTICQLEDGTSAFEDELPKGAKVTESHAVTVHDGAMIGRYKTSERALMMLLAVTIPEEFGKAASRKRKPRKS